MTATVFHQLVQGSEAWAQFRLDHDGASEAAAMLGLSKRVSRGDLLRMKHTRVAREFTEWVQQNILDHGHAVEALARPIVEDMLGDELYPVTCSRGRLSASCDGLTMSGRRAWEHKQHNEALAASVAAGILPDEHIPQCQQILLVTGAEALRFTVSDGTPDRMVHMDVHPDPGWFARIEAGWAQFHADLAVYEPPQAAAPAPVGKAPDTLPALRIEVRGEVTASNLAAFKDTALAAIRSVNRDLKTDVDFADAECAVKWCDEVETRLAAAKEHALSQTQSIDVLFKTIDDISAEARRVRLDLDKLVKARKESIRGEIVAGAVSAFNAHLAAMQCAYLPRIPADFAGVIKGKKTVKGLQDAVDAELARVKIEANGHYQRIQQNLATLAEHREHAALFPDTAALVLKAPDDLAAAINSRIAKHQADEAARMERERERIRQEEQARAQRELAAKAQAEAAAQRQAEADALAKQRPAETVVVPAPVAAPVAAAFAATRAPAANEPATLKLGTICERLGFTMTAAFVAERLGIEPAATDKAAKLYRESDFARICAALLSHVGAMRVMHAKGERQEVAA